jgi:adenine-specific DNA-methyltransferase
MGSLAEREGLRGKVQCIYFDPPYGIKFNSNFQWSTTSRDVKDGKADHITREPEQVKAFRDTWRDGIHSYLSYIRDRLTVARDLLTESGSIFVQIGDENVHRVRTVMDEVFGEDNFVSEIIIAKTTSATAQNLAGTCDFVLFYAKNIIELKFRKIFTQKEAGTTGAALYNRIQSPDGLIVRPLTSNENFNRDYAPKGWHLVTSDNITSQSGGETTRQPYEFQNETYSPGSGGWKTNGIGLNRLNAASRLAHGGKALRYVRRILDFPVSPVANIWSDMLTGSFTEQKIYVVQTAEKIIQRCILMTTDPGDLVLDPTCGSGTTAAVAEQWGRRWITVDTSRVALALARSRIMGARYPFYLLADSPEGQKKEADITRTIPSSKPTFGNIRHGFVYERVPHITLKSIANNAEIDVIWEKYQAVLEPLRERLNTALGLSWQEWEIPRELTEAQHRMPLPQHGIVVGATIGGDTSNPANWHCAGDVHRAWWDARINRQKEIDASIAAKADTEYLYDKPFEDKKKVRVAGPFTVETLSPHRMLGVDEHDNLIDDAQQSPQESHEREGFAEMILANLRDAGVQQAHKEDKITFQSLTPWPGHYICAEGQYQEGESLRRAAIFIGPEFGTVARQNLVEAAREAGDGDFDVLIACAFSFDAHSSEFNKLGRIPVLKARMNADLHMAADLKSTGKGNLFVIFGEPDIAILEEGDQLRVKIHGVDVFDPRTGEVRSDGADGIACWFLDTDYNGESFFVRHAYFLGANDPYKSLKTTLKAEIDYEAWSTLNSDTSRPFTRPASGRIAVKVINHLGDEVMKVFGV